MKIPLDKSWAQESHKAEFWEVSDDNSDNVICKLSPRNCRIYNGKMGKCGVRGNINGELRTFNYGKSVEATMEVIETEAVYHYMPGATILSLGNIGCMMSCDFCQNWKTSQVRHLRSRDVRYYTPRQIVDTCKSLGIYIISWTYNDPVVWHEFVVETSKLAQKEGTKTLYKSAFYIEEEAVKELIDCIDIFSISLKSMSNEFYKKFTGGARLQPVLDRILQINESYRHLEVSQLVITGRNDNKEEIEKTNQWVYDNLHESVPLHYVGFHPAYLYMDVGRTSEEVLLMAKQMATDTGIKHCYVGNTFKQGISDTFCRGCGAVLVRRFGLTSEVVGIAEDNTCLQCKIPTDIVLPHGNRKKRPFQNAHNGRKYHNTRQFEWNPEAQSVHVEISQETDLSKDTVEILVDRLGAEESESEKYFLGGILRRIIVSKKGRNEKGIQISTDSYANVNVYPVLDRAHFPTSTDLDEALKGYRETENVEVIALQ